MVIVKREKPVALSCKHRGFWLSAYNRIVVYSHHILLKENNMLSISNLSKSIRWTSGPVKMCRSTYLAVKLSPC
jgi:hypothetical protein